jgi:hypothetical protein
MAITPPGAGQLEASLRGLVSKAPAAAEPFTPPQGYADTPFVPPQAYPDVPYMPPQGLGQRVAAPMEQLRQLVAQPGPSGFPAPSLPPMPAWPPATKPTHGMSYRELEPFLRPEFTSVLPGPEEELQAEFQKEIAWGESTPLRAIEGVQMRMDRLPGYDEKLREIEENRYAVWKDMNVPDALINIVERGVTERGLEPWEVAEQGRDWKDFLPIGRRQEYLESAEGMERALNRLEGIPGIDVPEPMVGETVEEYRQRVLATLPPEQVGEAVTVPGRPEPMGLIPQLMMLESEQASARDMRQDMLDQADKLEQDADRADAKETFRTKGTVSMKERGMTFRRSQSVDRFIRDSRARAAQLRAAAEEGISFPPQIPASEPENAVTELQKARAELARITDAPAEQYGGVEFQVKAMNELVDQWGGELTGLGFKMDWETPIKEGEPLSPRQMQLKSQLDAANRKVGPMLDKLHRSHKAEDLITAWSVVGLAPSKYVEMVTIKDHEGNYRTLPRVQKEHAARFLAPVGWETPEEWTARMEKIQNAITYHTAIYELTGHPDSDIAEAAAMELQAQIESGEAGPSVRAVADIAGYEEGEAITEFAKGLRESWSARAAETEAMEFEFTDPDTGELRHDVHRRAFENVTDDLAKRIIKKEVTVEDVRQELSEGIALGEYYDIGPQVAQDIYNDVTAGWDTYKNVTLIAAAGEVQERILEYQNWEDSLGGTEIAYDRSQFPDEFRLDDPEYLAYMRRFVDDSGNIVEGPAAIAAANWGLINDRLGLAKINAEIIETNNDGDPVLYEMIPYVMLPQFKALAPALQAQPIARMSLFTQTVAMPIEYALPLFQTLYGINNEDIQRWTKEDAKIHGAVDRARLETMQNFLYAIHRSQPANAASTEEGGNILQYINALHTRQLARHPYSTKKRLTIEQATKRWELSRWKFMAMANTILMESTLPQEERSPGPWKDVVISAHDQADRFVSFLRDSDIVSDSAFRAQLKSNPWFSKRGARQYPINDPILKQLEPQTREYWKSNQRHERQIGYNIFEEGEDVRFDPARGSIEAINAPIPFREARALRDTVDFTDEAVFEENKITRAALIQQIAHDDGRGYGVPNINDTHALINGVWKYQDADNKYKNLISVLEDADDATSFGEFFTIHVPYSFNRMVRGMYLITKESLGYVVTGLDVALYAGLEKWHSWWEDDPMEHFEEYTMPNGKTGFRAKPGSREMFADADPLREYVTTNEMMKIHRAAKEQAKADFVRKSFLANEALKEMIRFYGETYTDWDKFKGYLAHDPIPAILDVMTISSVLGWTGTKGMRAAHIKRTRHLRLDRAQKAIKRKQRLKQKLTKQEEMILEGGPEAEILLGMELPLEHGPAPRGQVFERQKLDKVIREGLSETDKALLAENGHRHTTQAARTYGAGVSLRSLPQRFMHVIGDHLINRAYKRMAAGADVGALNYHWTVRMLSKATGYLDSNLPIISPVLHDAGKFFIREAASGSKTGMLAQYFMSDRTYMSRDVRYTLALGEQQSNLIIEKAYADNLRAIDTIGRATLAVDRVPTIKQALQFSSKEAMLEKTGSTHTFRTKRTPERPYQARVDIAQTEKAVLEHWDDFEPAMNDIIDNKIIGEDQFVVTVETPGDARVTRTDVTLYDMGLVEKPRKITPSKLSKKQKNMLYSQASESLKVDLDLAMETGGDVWVSAPKKKATKHFREKVAAERKHLEAYLEEVARQDIRMKEAGPARETTLVNMPMRLPNGEYIAIPVLLDDVIKVWESPAVAKAAEDSVMLAGAQGVGHLDDISPGGAREHKVIIRGADVTTDGVSVGSGPDYMAQAYPEVIETSIPTGEAMRRVKQPDGTYVIEMDLERLRSDWEPPAWDKEVLARLKREYREALAEETLSAAEGIVEHEGVKYTRRGLEFKQTVEKLEADMRQAETYIGELEDLHLRRDEARKAGQPDPDTGAALVKVLEDDINSIKERIKEARLAVRSTKHQLKTTPEDVYKVANKKYHRELIELRTERKEVLRKGAVKEMDRVSLEQTIDAARGRFDDIAEQIAVLDDDLRGATDAAKRKELTAERKLLTDERVELAEQIKAKQGDLDKLRPGLDVMREAYKKLEDLKERRVKQDRILNTEPTDSPAFEVAEATLRRIDDQIEAAKAAYDAAKLRRKHGVTPKPPKVRRPKGEKRVKLPHGVPRGTLDHVVARVREIDVSIQERIARMDANKAAAHKRWPAEKARLEAGVKRLGAEIESLETARAQRIKDIGRADEAVFDLDKELKKARTRRTRASNKLQRERTEYEAEKLELRTAKEPEAILQRQTEHPARVALREYTGQVPGYRMGTDVHAPILETDLFPTVGEYQDFLMEYARVDASIPKSGQKGYRVGQTRAERRAAVTKETLKRFKEGRAGLPDPGRVRDAKGNPVEFHLLEGELKEAVRDRAYFFTLEDIGLVRKQGKHWVATERFKQILRESNNEFRLMTRELTTPSSLSTLMEHVGNMLADGRGLIWVSRENLTVHAGWMKAELKGSQLKLEKLRGIPKEKPDAQGIAMRELADALGLEPVLATTEPSILNMVAKLYKIGDQARVKAWRKGLPKTASRVEQGPALQAGIKGQTRTNWTSVKAANKEYSLLYDQNGNPITFEGLKKKIKSLPKSERVPLLKLLRKHKNIKSDRVILGYNMADTTMGKIIKGGSQDTASLLKVIDEASYQMKDNKIGRGRGETFTAELEHAWRISRASSLQRLRKNPLAAVRLAFSSMNYQERISWMSWMRDGVLPQVTIENPKILSTWERVGLVDLVDGKPKLTPLGATSTLFVLDHSSHFYKTMFLRSVLSDSGQFAGAYDGFFNAKNYVAPEYFHAFEMVQRTLNDVQSGLAMDWVRHINALGIEKSPSAIANALTHWTRVHQGTFMSYLHGADATQKIAKSIMMPLKKKRMLMTEFYDAQLRSGGVMTAMTPFEAAMFARIEVNANMFRVEAVKRFFDEGYIAPGIITESGTLRPPTDDGGWMRLNLDELMGKRKTASVYNSINGRIDPTAPLEAQAAFKRAQELGAELAANEFRYLQHLDDQPDYNLQYIFGDLAKVQNTYFIRRTQAKVINLENRVQSSYVKHAFRLRDKFHVADKLRKDLTEATSLPVKKLPSPGEVFNMFAGAGLGYVTGLPLGHPYTLALAGGVAGKVFGSGLIPGGVFAATEFTYKAADVVNKNFVTKAFKVRKLFQSFVGPMARNMQTNTLLQWMMDPKMMLDPVWRRYYKDYWHKYRNGVIDSDFAREAASLDIVQAGVSKEIGYQDMTRLSKDIDSWLSGIYKRTEDFGNYLKEAKELVDIGAEVKRLDAGQAAQMSIEMGLSYEQAILEGKIVPEAMRNFQIEAARAHVLPPKRTMTHAVTDFTHETRQAFAPLFPWEGMGLSNRFLRWGKNAFNHTDDSFKYAYAGYLYEVEGLRGPALRARVFERWPDYSNITNAERIYTLKQAFGVYQTKYFQIMTRFMHENPLYARALMHAHEMSMAAELSDPETYESWLNLPPYRKWMVSRYPMGWLDESSFSVMGVERFETSAWNNPVFMLAVLLFNKGSMYHKGLPEGFDADQWRANFLRTLTDTAYGSAQINPWELANVADMMRTAGNDPSWGDVMGSDAPTLFDDPAVAISQAAGPRAARIASAAGGHPYRYGSDRPPESLATQAFYNTIGMRTVEEEPNFIDKVRGRRDASIRKTQGEIRSLLRRLNTRSVTQKLPRGQATASVKEYLDYKNKLEHLEDLIKFKESVIHLGVDRPNAKRVIGMARRMFMARLREPSWVVEGEEYKMVQPPPGWRTDEDIEKRMAEIELMRAQDEANKATMEMRNERMKIYLKRYGLIR